MARLKSRKLERVRYWQGQMLRSQDFQDIEEVEAQRRAWHNRALHNAYGVAEGLACSLVPSLAPTGVSISPGLAYDVFGRELILVRPLIIPLPADVPQGLIGAVSLLMRYKPLHPMRPDEISEVCWNARGSITAGTAEFVWALGDRLDPALGVAVYAIYYSASGLIPDPYFNRISLQPLAGPLLASGSTIPGSTPWEPWILQVSGPLINLGVQTRIDTSAAGFTSIPCYFAALQGPLWSPKTLQLVPALFPSITGAAISGFTFRLWLQLLPPQNDLRTRLAAQAAGLSFITSPSDFLLYAQQQNLYVSWVGCQMLAAATSCTTPAPSATLGAASLASAFPLKS